MDFDVKTENFEKTRLSIVKLAVWLVYNAFLILYNGYRMMLASIELRKLVFNGAIYRNQSGMKD